MCKRTPSSELIGILESAITPQCVFAPGDLRQVVLKVEQDKEYCYDKTDVQLKASSIARRITRNAPAVAIKRPTFQQPKESH
jgi:hypothetical protein